MKAMHIFETIGYETIRYDYDTKAVQLRSNYFL